MTQRIRQRLELAALLAVGITPFYLNGLYNTPLAARGHAGFWLVEVSTWIVLPTVLMLIGRRRGLFTLTDLGLTTRVRGRERPWMVLALVATVPVLMLPLDLSVARWANETLPAGWPLPSFRYALMIPPPGPQSGWWRLLVLIHLCVTAGVVEELYYRAAFDQLFGRGCIAAIAYVLSSSAVFAGAHWEGGLPNLAEAFAVGVFAASVFRVTQNVWPLIVGHVLTDWYWFTPGA